MSVDIFICVCVCVYICIYIYNPNPNPTRMPSLLITHLNPPPTDTITHADTPNPHPPRFITAYNTKNSKLKKAFKSINIVSPFAQPTDIIIPLHIKYIFIDNPSLIELAKTLSKDMNPQNRLWNYTIA
uniref:Uncharacterized protein n=1 Tax=Octopus bimaculoides TaxID=37653 RepID=A0A0L8GFS2_OCTBM